MLMIKVLPSKCSALSSFSQKWHWSLTSIFNKPQFTLQLCLNINISRIQNEKNTWKVLPRPMVWARIQPRPLSPDFTFLIDCIMFSHINLIPVTCKYETSQIVEKTSQKRPTNPRKTTHAQRGGNKKIQMNNWKHKQMKAYQLPRWKVSMWSDYHCLAWCQSKFKSK